MQDQVDSKIGYNIVFNHCHTFAEDLALRIGHATSVKSITKFPINSASSHRPFAASQITRVFDYTDPGIEYKSIADAMREGLTDQPTELDEESVMISSVMGIQMPLEKPTNDSVERSATQGRESVSSSPGTYYGDSDTYGRSFRDELQPDWYARPRTPESVDKVTVSDEKDDDREGDPRESDKKADHGGESWRFEAPF